jgi:hypothetical protein
MRKPLTRDQLAVMQCQAPGCTHVGHDELYLHGRCHPESPTWCAFYLSTGTLKVVCAECDNMIAEIAVAP